MLAGWTHCSLTKEEKCQSAEHNEQKRCCRTESTYILSSLRFRNANLSVFLLQWGATVLWKEQTGLPVSGKSHSDHTVGKCGKMLANRGTITVLTTFLHRVWRCESFSCGCLSAAKNTSVYTKSESAPQQESITPQVYHSTSFAHVEDCLRNVNCEHEWESNKTRQNTSNKHTK